MLGVGQEKLTKGKAPQSEIDAATMTLEKIKAMQRD